MVYGGAVGKMICVAKLSIHRTSAGSLVFSSRLTPPTSAATAYHSRQQLSNSSYEHPGYASCSPGRLSCGDESVIARRLSCKNKRRAKNLKGERRKSIQLPGISLLHPDEFEAFLQICAACQKRLLMSSSRIDTLRLLMGPSVAQAYLYSSLYAARKYNSLFCILFSPICLPQYLFLLITFKIWQIQLYTAVSV